ncbi:unnamed protein product, partial [Didymodactylos carnosus]
MLSTARLWCRPILRTCVPKYIRTNTTSKSSLPPETGSLGRDSLLSSYTFPSMSKSVSWLPDVKYAQSGANRYETHVTTLDNGLKVASEKLFGDFCTVGVIISAGPRFEGGYMNGISHFLEKLAFMSTTNYANRDLIQDSLQSVNAICDCQNSKDIIIYALSCRTSGLERVVDILSETIFQPKLLSEELEEAQAAVFGEIDNLYKRYDPTPILTDMIHSVRAGYGNQTLGLPKFTPLENISKIDSKLIYSYMNDYYRPERM